MNTRRSNKFTTRSLIENLPTEMHLEIFQYLDAASIRRCSETCKTFFNVSLRHEFKHCFKLCMLDTYLAMSRGIGSVFSVSKRTLRTYDKLYLGKVELKTLPFAKNFMMRLGKDVTELHLYEKFFTPLMIVKETENIEINLRKEVLKNFPKLKKLTVENAKMLDTLTFYPISLEEITVKEAIVNHDSLDDSDFTDYLMKTKGASGLKVVHVGETSYSCYCLKNVRKNNLHEISDEVFQAIEKISDLENFESIGTNCNILGHKRIDRTCVTTISFNWVSGISYASLALFPNLESIEMSIHGLAFNNRRCFSDHTEERPDMSHIKQLTVRFIGSLTCNDCITNILSSFTGLKSLVIHGNFTEDQVRLIFINMPDLETLSLNCNLTNTLFDADHPGSIANLKKLKALRVGSNDVLDSLSGALNNESFLNFASMPNLESLILNDYSVLSFSGIANLIQKCPKIKEFISYSASIDDEMVKEMVRNWRELQNLGLACAKELTADTFDVIKNTCKHLRSITFHYQPCLTFEIECSMFEKISTLKVITSGVNNTSMRSFNRSEFYEKDTYLQHFRNSYTNVQLKRKHHLHYQGPPSKKRRLTYSFPIYHSPGFFSLSSNNFMMDHANHDEYHSDEDASSQEEEEEEEDSQYNGCVIA